MIESKKPSKKKIKPSSAKAKGRRWQQEVGRSCAECIGLEFGKDCAIDSREMGQSGVDIKVIGEKAKKLFPFSVECKNAERWSLFEWIKQAQKNQLPETDWLLFLNRNKKAHGEETGVVVMSTSTFYKALKKGAFTKE